MKFVYNNKDTYSQEELDAILEQHKGYVGKEYKGFVAPEDYNKVVDELKPFKTQARTKHISTLVGELTSEDKLGDAIALSGLTEDDDDDSIVSKVKATIEKRKYLQKDVATPVEVKKQLKTKAIKKESKKKYRFN